jgi:hypothetical protein
MITLLIILAWMLPALATFRRVGYVLNQRMLETNHTYKIICHSCTCSVCGDDAFTHRGSSPCYGGKWVGMHPSSFFQALAVSMLGWPAVVALYGGAAVKKKFGLETNPFFVAPPAIETKHEKAMRELAEAEEVAAQREIEAAKREAVIREKEKSLGIV